MQEPISYKVDWTTTEWSENGVSLQRFGKIVTVQIRSTFSTDPTVGPFDNPVYTICTLPVRPSAAVVGPTHSMNSSNGTIADIFFELSTGGILRIRNYSATGRTVHRVFASFSFMADE